MTEDGGRPFPTPPDGRLLDVVESLSEAVAVFDGADALTFANGRFRRLCAALGDTVRPGLRFADMATALAHAGVVAGIAGREADWARRFVDHRRDRGGAFEIVLAAGGVVEVELSALPCAQAGPPGTVVVARDVTALKRAAEMVLGREQRLRGIMNTVLDAIITIDEAGLIESFNPAAERLFGYRADEVVGRSVTLLMADPARHDDSFVATYLTPGQGRVLGIGCEEAGRRKDGTVIPIELSIGELELNGRRLFAGVARDLTTAKAAEQALRRSEERYVLAMAGTSEGMWDWDVASDQLFLSARLIQLLGLGDDVPQRSRGWPPLIHPEDRPVFRAKLLDHLRGDTDFFACEYRLAGHAEVRWFRHRGLALRNADGRAYRMAGSTADVTAQKLAEASLRDAKEQAELASRAKTEFLANMSHELRTPLNAIIGFSEVMMGEMLGPVANARYKDYIGNIHESGRHLLDVINDILDVSRIEAGQLELEPEVCNVVTLAESSLRLVNQRAEAAGLTLECHLDPALPTLFGETRRLKQVLLNLLSNAVKFTPAGGTVRLAVHRDAACGTLVMTVADTGIGMRPEDIPKALTPFAQVDSTLSRRYEGTGLGLPLAKAFVELHGGTLDIASEPGKGTTVRLCFPAERLVE